MKIDISPLGLKKKTAVIKPTIKVTDQAQLIQIQVLEMQDPTITKDWSMVQSIKRAREARQTILEFYQDIFKLTDNDMKRIADNLTEGDIGDFFGYLTYRLQGFSDEQIKLEDEKQEKVETDPKKD